MMGTWKSLRGVAQSQQGVNPHWAAPFHTLAEQLERATTYKVRPPSPTAAQTGCHSPLPWGRACALCHTPHPEGPCDLQAGDEDFLKWPM